MTVSTMPLLLTLIGTLVRLLDHAVHRAEEAALDLLAVILLPVRRHLAAQAVQFQQLEDLLLLGRDGVEHDPVAPDQLEAFAQDVGVEQVAVVPYRQLAVRAFDVHRLRVLAAAGASRHLSAEAKFDQ